MRRHSDTPAATSRAGSANSALCTAWRVIAASRKVHRAALSELSSNIDNSVMANLLANIPESTAEEISPDELQMRERRPGVMAVLTASSAEGIARHLAALGPVPAH